MQNFRALIQNIMTEAEGINAHSLAIPPVGAGNIGFSASVVAKVMTEEVANYIETHSESCINDVRFVVLPWDKSLLQVADISQLKDVFQNAITFVIINSNFATKSIDYFIVTYTYWVGQIKRGQCSFFRRSKARILIIFSR